RMVGLDLPVSPLAHHYFLTETIPEIEALDFEVAPDIDVEQLPKEVIAGKDPQLEKAIEVIMQELKANPPKTYKTPEFPTRVRK
ncbi:MAG: hypothetical protein AAF696_12965, partial [Bacteroidota bacterium]